MSSRQMLSVMLSFGYSVDWLKFLFSHVDAMGFNSAPYTDVIPNMSQCLTTSVWLFHIKSLSQLALGMHARYAFLFGRFSFE